MIIHAGDMSGRGTIQEISNFLQWYAELPHKYKILIAGNHDKFCEENPALMRELCDDFGIDYLEDESITIKHVKIHGSPRTPEFCDWAFNCWRTKKEKEDPFRGYLYPYIGDYWDLIPYDTDILVTHGPPAYVLDKCPGGNVGCDRLLETVQDIKPKYHVFGHIHESAGDINIFDTQFINAAVLDGRYDFNNNKIKVWEI
jgi:Icc-related predicted phosphoesterase